MNSAMAVVSARSGLPEPKVVLIDDHEMITLGFTNHSPWNSPREVDENVLEDMLEKMCSQVVKMKNCIFNVHCPPYDTILDQAPALDSTLRPIMKNGDIQMIPVGSAAVRKSIEKYAPLAGIHGHVHESRGVTKVGGTTCFNPGSEYTEGILRGLVFDLEGDRIADYMFTAG